MSAPPLHAIAETILSALRPQGAGFDPLSSGRVEEEIRRALSGPPREAQRASDAILTVLGLLDARGETAAVRALVALSERLGHERAARDQGTAQRIVAFQSFEGTERPRALPQAAPEAGSVPLFELCPPPLRG